MLGRNRCIDRRQPCQHFRIAFSKKIGGFILVVEIMDLVSGRNALAFLPMKSHNFGRTQEGLYSGSDFFAISSQQTAIVAHDGFHSVSHQHPYG